MPKLPFRPLLALACLGLLGPACGEPQASDGASPASEAPPSAERAGEEVLAVLALEAPLERAAGLATLLSRLEPAALPAVRRALADAGLDTADGEVELALFATWWAGFDPEAALEWARRDWRAPTAAQAAVLRRWAEREPGQAWNRAQDLLPGPREAALDAVVASWARHDGPGLEAFVAALPASALKVRAGETLAREQTASLGAEAALAWADDLEDAEFRDFMRKRVAGAAGLVEPEVAAAWAAPQIDASPRTNGLARRVATRWVLSDPEAAMAWLSTLPAGETRDDGVLEAYRDWLRLAPQDAIRWIRSQQADPWLEPALALYARRSLLLNDPEAAFAVAEGFRDERLRSTTLTQLARQWLTRDYEAADAWIQQADLPEDVVERAYMLPNPEVREKRAQRRAQGLAADRIP